MNTHTHRIVLSFRTAEVDDDDDEEEEEDKNHFTFLSHVPTASRARHSCSIQLIGIADFHFPECLPYDQTRGGGGMNIICFRQSIITIYRGPTMNRQISDQ